jgi:hypothetical protein
MSSKVIGKTLQFRFVIKILTHQEIWLRVPMQNLEEEIVFFGRCGAPTPGMRGRLSWKILNPPSNVFEGQCSSGVPF